MVLRGSDPSLGERCFDRRNLSGDWSSAKTCKIECLCPALSRLSAPSLVLVVIFSGALICFFPATNRTWPPPRASSEIRALYYFVILNQQFISSRGIFTAGPPLIYSFPPPIKGISGISDLSRTYDFRYRLLLEFLELQLGGNCLFNTTAPTLTPTRKMWLSYHYSIL